MKHVLRRNKPLVNLLMNSQGAPHVRKPQPMPRLNLSVQGFVSLPISSRLDRENLRAQSDWSLNAQKLSRRNAGTSSFPTLVVIRGACRWSTRAH